MGQGQTHLIFVLPWGIDDFDPLIVLSFFISMDLDVKR